MSTNDFSVWDGTPVELFYHWLNRVCNDMYSVWWDGDCEEHLVDHSESTHHQNFVDLLEILYKDKLGGELFGGSINCHADVPNGVFYISSPYFSQITIKGIDNTIHHTHLVKKEKDENVRPEES